MTKKDLKAGMVCEVEEHGERGLVMITYNSHGELIMSGETIYGKLDKLDEDTLTYGYGAHKFIKVYDRSLSNLAAHKLSTENRELLWERPTYYNGKVVCVERNNEFITKGKIYEFKDGFSIDDDGDRLPMFTPIVSLEHLNETMYSKFIEVVE